MTGETDRSLTAVRDLLPSGTQVLGSWDLYIVRLESEQNAHKRETRYTRFAVDIQTCNQKFENQVFFFDGMLFRGTSRTGELVSFFIREWDVGVRWCSSEMSKPWSQKRTTIINI